MSEILKGGEQGSSSQGSDWDMLTALANKNIHKDEQGPVRGASEKFKREAAEHQANAEAIMDGMSDAQLEALSDAGIRDATDAGEYLHEAASWAKQVEQMASALDGNLARYDQQLIEAGENNGLDPVTGERVESSLFAPFDDVGGQMAADFQEMQEKLVWSNSAETWAMGDLIRDESRAKKEQGVDDGLADVVLPGEDSDQRWPNAIVRPEAPEPRSREALNDEAIERWKADVLGDEEKKEKVENSVFYATLKRKMQKEAEKQNQEAS